MDKDACEEFLILRNLRDESPEPLKPQKSKKIVATGALEDLVVDLEKSEGVKSFHYNNEEHSSSPLTIC